MSELVINNFILDGFLSDVRNYRKLDKKDPKAVTKSREIIESIKSVDCDKYASLKTLLDERYNEESGNTNYSAKIEELAVLSTAKRFFSNIVFESAKDIASKMVTTRNDDINVLLNSKSNNTVVDLFRLLSPEELKSVCNNIDERPTSLNPPIELTLAQSFGNLLPWWI